jgi:Cyclin, N-terminal domain
MFASSAAITSSQFIDLSQLPSVQDGSCKTVEEESLKRRKTCRFIEESGRILKLPRVAVSTAMVFFHRFYARHSFAQHDRFEVAVACIVLAGKTEESPRKLNHVMEECYNLKLRGQQAGRISQAAAAAAAAKGGGGGGASPIGGVGSASASSSPQNTSSSTSIDPKGAEFFKIKERVLLLERVILHTIGFELSVDHPYKFLVEQIKKLVHQRKLEYIPTPPSASAAAGASGANLSSSQLASKMLNELVQYAMNFANDSMQTSLCLQFEPQTIAMATVFLAANFCKIRPAAGKGDWLVILAPPTPSTTASSNSSGGGGGATSPPPPASSSATNMLSSLEVQALASIVLQIIELVLDRKGTDPIMFQQIKRELNALQQMTDANASAASTATGGGNSSSKPPPAATERETKRPRID